MSLLLALETSVPIIGTLSATLGDTTLSASAVVRVAAQLAQTLDDAQLAATAAVRVAAQMSKTLDDTTLAAVAHVDVIAQLSQQLDDAIVSAQAAVRVAAIATATTDDVVLAAQAKVTVVAQLVQTLDDTVLAAIGQTLAPIIATLTATLDDALLVADAIVYTVEAGVGVAPLEGGGLPSARYSAVARRSRSTSVIGERVMFAVTFYDVFGRAYVPTSVIVTVRFRGELALVYEDHEVSVDEDGACSVDVVFDEVGDVVVRFQGAGAFVDIHHRVYMGSEVDRLWARVRG